MSKEDWIKNPVHKILQDQNLWPFAKNEIKTVLDVACGLALKSKFLEPCMILGVDIYEPYLKAIEADIPYAVIKYDVRKLGDLFLDNSFDIVYAIDILEHLEKTESIRLINRCKRIARKAVVIETPNGPIPQNLDTQGLEGHYYQTHRCHWDVTGLKKMDFRCIVRPYKMQDVKRHTDRDVDPNIELIDGIFRK